MRNVEFFCFCLFLALSAIAVVFNVAATDALFLHSTGGSSVKGVSLDNIQRLTFNGDSLLLKTADGNETCYLLDTVKITFEDYDVTGISALPNTVEIKMYPNPSSDYVIIDSPVAITSWTLFDLSGSKLKHSDASSQIQVSDLSAGIYILKIDTANGIITKKIIKK